MALCRVVSEIFNVEKCRDLEMVVRVRGHSRSFKVVPSGRSCMVSYYRSLVTLSLKRTVFAILPARRSKRGTCYVGNMSGWLAGWLGGCPSHASIVSKRLNLSENFFDHLKAPSF